MEQGFAEQGAVCEVAVDPTDGVEAGSEVFAAAPEIGSVLTTDGGGGAISCKAAEGGGDSNGASGVGTNGGHGGALLDACSASAGGASGEQAGVGRLEAVAVVGVFSGDSVGELGKVSFAGDDGSGAPESCGDL